MAELVLLTPQQIKMAKAALGWSNHDLAIKTGLHRNTIQKAENGKGRDATLALIKAAFEASSLVFIAEGQSSRDGGVGVRLI